MSRSIIIFTESPHVPGQEHDAAQLALVFN